MGRPLGSKGTIPFNLGKLLELFGPNICPDISTKWLKQHGLLNDNNLPINNGQMSDLKPQNIQTQIQFTKGE